MHAILATVGTSGDIFPYAGLGVRLKERGHRVTLATSENFHPLAKNLDLEFLSLVSTAENDELFMDPDFWHPVKTIKLSARWGRRFVERQYTALAAQAKEKDAVFITSPAVFAATMAAEKFDRPLTNLVLQPWMIRSSIAPPIVPGAPFLQSLPPIGVSCFWSALDGLVQVMVGRHLNKVRAKAGLPPIARVFRSWLAPKLVIGMFPAWYGPPQSDWPPQLRQTGFPRFDSTTGAKLSDDLAKFCSAGTPPVVYTFGTGMRHAMDVFHAAVEACARLGVRGILLTRHRDQLPAQLPPSIFHSEFAPFHELFPRSAVVVHHGGIGTTAEAFAAGVPQLILPFCFDQMDNGARVKLLGAGDSISGRKDGAAIAKALEPLLKPEARERCREIAARFHGSDPLIQAADWVEELAGAAC